MSPRQRIAGRLQLLAQKHSMYGGVTPDFKRKHMNARFAARTFFETTAFAAALQFSASVVDDQSQPAPPVQATP